MNTKRILCIVTLLLIVLITACEAVHPAEIKTTEEPEAQEEAALTDVAQDEIEDQEAPPLLGDVEPPTDFQTTNQNALELIEIQHFGKGNINDIVWSPVGNPIAIATVTGIYLIDPKTNEEVHLTNYASYGLAFSKEGTCLVSSEGSSIVFRDLESGSEQSVLEVDGNHIREIALSPLENLLAATSSDQTIRVWDLTTKEKLFSLEGPGTFVYDVAFSNDGERLVSASYTIDDDDPRFRIWDMKSGQEIPMDSEIMGSAFAISPVSETIAAGGLDNPLSLLDFNGQVRLTLDEEPKSVFDLAFSPDGKVLGSITLNGSEEPWTIARLKLWDTASGKLLHTLDDKGEYHNISFSPDSKQVAAATFDQAKLWDVESGQDIGIITDQSDSSGKLGFGKGGVNDFAWSPDGNTLALATFSGVSLFNIETHEEIRLSSKGNQPQIGHIITFSPDGKLLAVSYSFSGEVNVEVYDVESQELLFTLDDFEDMGVFGIAFSPDNSRLATGWGNPWGFGSGSVKIWDMSTGTMVSELGRDYDETIYNLAYSSDGKLLAGISGIGQVHIWNLAEETEEMTFSGTSGFGFAVAFSPDGRLLAAGGAASNGSEYNYDVAELRLFDLVSGELVFKLEGHQAIIRSLAFNPDGGVLASASWDGTVRLWDTQTGEQLAKLNVPGATSVGFNPDGTLLATAGDGDVLRLWSVPEPIIYIPSTTRTQLSSEEILQRADAFEAIITANAEAWNAADLDAIQAVLTEDIHFVDETYSDYQEGIDQVLNMARGSIKLNPDAQRQVTSQYINRDEAIAVYDYWNLNLSSKQFTPEDPLIHAFLFEREGDQISSWRVFYSTESMVDIHRISEFEAEQMQSLVAAYADRWSSIDPSSVAEMYADDALRRDTLFNEYQDGRSAITSFAETFFSWCPDAHWTPLEAFGERAFRNKPQAVGSSYRIEVTDVTGEVCEIEAVVLLYVFEGKIVQEDLYYEPGSLIQCGWAE